MFPMNNVLVPIEMLIMPVIGINYISIQFFSTLVGMGSILWRWAEYKILNLFFSRTLQNVHFGSDFCSDVIVCTLSGDLERIFSILYTKYIDKWLQLPIIICHWICDRKKNLGCLPDNHSTVLIMVDTYFAVYIAPHPAWHSTVRSTHTKDHINIIIQLPSI